MATKHNLGIRITDEFDQALRKAAERDQRSMANVVVFVMTKWLQEQGFLKPDKETVD